MKTLGAEFMLFRGYDQDNVVWSGKVVTEDWRKHKGQDGGHMYFQDKENDFSFCVILRQASETFRSLLKFRKIGLTYSHNWGILSTDSSL